MENLHNGLGYEARPLAPGQIPQAYPLIALFDADLTQDQWSRYAADVIDGSNGSGGLNGAGHQSILTVQNDRGYIFGLSSYWIRPDLWRDKVLDIENFAVADIIRGRKVAVVLLEALERTARAHDCSCLSIRLIHPKIRHWLRGGDGPTPDVFETAGFKGDRLRLRKCF